MKAIIDRITAFMKGQKEGEVEEIDNGIVPLPAFPDINAAVRYGFILVFVFLGGFLFWAMQFELSSAAVAEGEIKVYSKVRDIQHLEGGIVKALYVRDSQSVKAGDKLLLLESTQSHATTRSLELQLYALEALEERLLAERDDKKTLSFPKHINDSLDRDVQKIKKGQRRLFNARRKTKIDNAELLKAKINLLKDEVASTALQAKSADDVIVHMSKELAAFSALEKNHYVEKTQILRLKRELAKEQKERHEVVASIAQAKQRINDTQLQLLNLDKEYIDQVIAELRDTRERLFSVRQEYKSAKDVSKRALIRAPISGKIVSMTVDTLGAVISPGQTVMNIVPSDDQLIIEAKINPNDIDVVTVGLKAQVMLSALKTRNLDPIEAEVVTISGDILIDQQSGMKYYLAELKINPESLKNLPKNIKLQPGMPAQVNIILYPRTLWRYATQPLMDTFNRAFRED